MFTLPLPTAVESPPPEHALHPRGLADGLLLAAFRRRAAAIWIEPVGGEVHRVSLERGRGSVAAAELAPGLGDAVIARFSLIAHLDLARSGLQTGRVTVRGGSCSADVVVTVRPTGRGLSAELRLLPDELPAAPRPAATGVPAELPAGYAVGSYRIDRLLGGGGMGLVYRATHTLLRRRAAIKVLRREVLDRDEVAVQRFIREARTTSRLDHPGIVHVIDVATLRDGRPYIVMELVGGADLAQRADDEGAMPPLRAVRIARGVAEALAAAHDKGVVHRDLSAGNVFVLDDESIKLVDFGGARTLGEDDAVPDGPPGIVVGTPWYMSPEQCCAQPCTPRSDLYSLGVLLFEMLSGEVPFQADTAGAIARQHVRATAPRVTSPLEVLPAALEHVVARLLRKDPNERFQSAAELADELERIEGVIQRPGWRKWLPV